MLNQKLRTDGTPQGSRTVSEPARMGELNGGRDMRIEVFPWVSTEENLKDIKERQKISKKDLEKIVKILQASLEQY